MHVDRISALSAGRAEGAGIIIPAVSKDFDELPLASAWAVGVSGGADSVALLAMLRRGRPDLALHVVHVDHELRGAASAGDASFVVDLGAKLGVASCTVIRRSEIEASAEADALPRNPSARWRAVRITAFKMIATERALAGTILAHHADDQAETIVARLLRGSGPLGLAGMGAQTTIGGMKIVRPLLARRRDELRDWLRSAGQTWREDASNTSLDYQRNRIRQVLARRPEWIEPVLALGTACARWRAWVERCSPKWTGNAIPLDEVHRTSPPLARAGLKRWLAEAASIAEERLDAGVISRIFELAEDVASPARVALPGGAEVRRSRGEMTIVRSADRKRSATRR